MSHDLSEVLTPATTIVATTTATAHYMDMLAPWAAGLSIVWLSIQILNFFWKSWRKHNE